MSLNLPGDFFVGSVTVGHQGEGQDVNSDWWALEHMQNTPVLEPSGDACDSLNRYGDDIDIAAEMGLDNFRFSVEWSRVEPADGEFSRAALYHYRRVLDRVVDAGMEPVVTFNHCSLPLWVSERGGWVWEDAAERFRLFCEVVAKQLAPHLRYVVTLTEPNVISHFGYRYGGFPTMILPGAPMEPGEEAQKVAEETLINAHHLARDAIRQVADGVLVGQCPAIVGWGCDPGYEEELDEFRREWEGNYFEAAEGDDYFGIAAYSRLWAGPQQSENDLPEGINKDQSPWFAKYPPGTPRTQMGYEFRPECVEEAIRRSHEKTGMPILVAECGVATKDDERRVEWLDRAFAGVGRCLDDGIEVPGLLYRSLLDDYYFKLGYGPRFGLAEVDRETFERRIKPSGRRLGEYARNGVRREPVRV